MNTTIFNTAAGVLRYTRRKNADYFDENNHEIRNLLYERNAAYRAKLSNYNVANDRRLTDVKEGLRRNLGDMDNDW